VTLVPRRTAGEGDRVRVEFGSYTVAVEGRDMILVFDGGHRMLLVRVTGFSSSWLI
jgi:hypothetical protein